MVHKQFAASSKTRRSIIYKYLNSLKKNIKGYIASKILLIKKKKIKTKNAEIQIIIRYQDSVRGFDFDDFVRSLRNFSRNWALENYNEMLRALRLLDSDLVVLNRFGASYLWMNKHYRYLGYFSLLISCTPAFGPFLELLPFWFLMILLFF